MAQLGQPGIDIILGADEFKAYGSKQFLAPDCCADSATADPPAPGVVNCTPASVSTV
jgi:hypothetical protein